MLDISFYKFLILGVYFSNRKTTWTLKNVKKNV